MRILHVTPHLGGGIGKAHAAIGGVLPKDIDRTYVLLEKPHDRRYMRTIEASGARIVIAGGLNTVAFHAGTADIVQFEYWNHPRMFECLARAPFLPMRSVIWSHNCGLRPPLFPAGLVEEAARFAFSTKASLNIPWVNELSTADRGKITTINSGFGITSSPGRRISPRAPVIAYLGTVDFVKMHPGFFDAIDGLQGDVRVQVWGNVDRDGPVARRHRAMQHPNRVELCGETDEPATALAQADIFFYPLQSDHYGTSENALIEAMSLGLTPVVLRNPAELEIVRHSETGLVAYSIDHCVSLLQSLLDSPDLRRRLSRNATADATQHRTPERSAAAFVELWRGLIHEAPRRPDFRRVMGDSPAEWFALTQGQDGSEGRAVANPRASKGSLAHFESVFIGDESLSRLRA